MHALMLAGLLTLSAAAEDEALLKQLDADYQALLPKERNPQQIKQAAQILETAPERYAEAVAILRRARPKAAIPLLLMYMLKHADLSENGYELWAYADTLSILAGIEAPDLSGRQREKAGRKQAARAAVAKLAKDWWQPGKDKLLTDLVEMERDNLWIVASRLMDKSGYEPRPQEREGAWGAWKLVEDSLKTDRRHNWWSEELHPVMIPALLGDTDYVEKPPRAKNARDPGRIAFRAVPFLAALRTSGEGDDIAKIAADAGQNSATRITCLLALAAAGEKLETKSLLALLDAEKKLDRQLALLVLVPRSNAPRAALPALYKMMDRPNHQVQLMSVYVLDHIGPKELDAKEMLPRLKKFLDDAAGGQGSEQAIRILGGVGDQQACSILVDYIEAYSKSDNIHLAYALAALGKATGQTWATDLGPGYNGATARKSAQAALAWWKKNRATGR